MQTRERNSNIEFLRIISMVLIVMHHCAYHGIGMDLAYSFNKYAVTAFGFGGKLGTDIFILISGYYMCRSRFTTRKFLRLYGQILFYSLGIWALFYVLGHPGNDAVLAIPDTYAGPLQLCRSILYMGSNRSWFVTVFVLLMLASPLLNIILERTDRQVLLAALSGAVLIWSILPTLLPLHYGYSDFLWCCVLYLIAGYIRLYGSDRLRARNLWLAAGSFLLMILSTSVLIWIDQMSSHRFDTDTLKCVSLYSPLTLLCSAEMLIIFTRLRPTVNKGINILASTMFGVYLIHDNNMMRTFLWNTLLGLPGSKLGGRRPSSSTHSCAWRSYSWYVYRLT